VDGDGLDSHFLASPDDAAGNLAAIGDQDFFELARVKGHKKLAAKKHKQHKTYACASCAVLSLNF
jgi:hypothetical protein